MHAGTFVFKILRALYIFNNKPMNKSLLKVSKKVIFLGQIQIECRIKCTNYVSMQVYVK